MIGSAFITCTGAFTGIPNRDDRIGMTDDDFHNAGVAAAMVHRRHARAASGHEGDIPPSQKQDIFTSRQWMKVAESILWNYCPDLRFCGFLARGRQLHRSTF
jgi:hypothetical protein